MIVYLSLKERLHLLGLSEEATERDIRRAYAVHLKQIDAEADPAGFQALYENYQWLLEWSRMPNRDQEFDYESFEVELEEGSTTEAAPEFDDAEYVDDESQDEQGAPAEAAVLNAMSDAEKLFSAMAAKFAALNTANSTHALVEAQRFLKAALADPALISIDTKGYFEWCVARHLSNGWRPGNEAMFEAAIVEFGWADDPRRLTPLQHIGYRINAAINERLAFNQQDMGERRTQLDVLRQLRLDEAPNKRVLIKNMERARFIEARFPNLLSMVSDAQNVAKWRKLHAKVGRWQRLLTFTNPMSKAAKRKEEGGRDWGMAWLFIGLIVFFNLLSIGGRNYNPPPRITLPPETSLYEPKVTAAWLTAPTEKEIEQKFAGKADKERCMEAHSLAQRFRPYENSQGVQFGTAYDLYVSYCAIANLWPKDSKSGRWVDVARGRLVEDFRVKADRRVAEDRAAREAAFKQKTESLSDVHSQQYQPRFTAEDLKRMEGPPPTPGPMITSGKDGYGLRYAPSPYKSGQEEPADVGAGQ